MLRRHLSALTIQTPGRSLIETGEVRSNIGQSGIQHGLLTLFIRHTSASLLIQENTSACGAIWNGFFARPVRDGENSRSQTRSLGQARCVEVGVFQHQRHFDLRLDQIMGLMYWANSAVAGETPFSQSMMTLNQKVQSFGLLLAHCPLQSKPIALRRHVSSWRLQPQALQACSCQHILHILGRYG